MISEKVAEPATSEEQLLQLNMSILECGWVETQD